MWPPGTLYSSPAEEVCEELRLDLARVSSVELRPVALAVPVQEWWQVGGAGTRRFGLVAVTESKQKKQNRKAVISGFQKSGASFFYIYIIFSFQLKRD